MVPCRVSAGKMQARHARHAQLQHSVGAIREIVQIAHQASLSCHGRSALLEP